MERKSQPVTCEASLVAHIETLAEQTHPLHLPRGLELSQPTVALLALVHLEEEEEEEGVLNKHCKYTVVMTKE